MVNSIKSLQAGGETPPLRKSDFAEQRATNGRPYVKARREKRPPPGGGSRVSGWGSTRDKGAFARQGSSSGCRTQSLVGGSQNKNELLSRALSPCRSRATPLPEGGFRQPGCWDLIPFSGGIWNAPLRCWIFAGTRVTTGRPYGFTKQDATQTRPPFRKLFKGARRKLFSFSPLMF